MKKNKRKTNYKERGITLIALVVTIIILLILAGITISLVTGNQGLLGRAQQASNIMAEATRNEMRKMNEFVDDIDTQTAGFINGQGTSETIEWTYNHSNQTIVGTKSGNTPIVLNVGDLVNYNAGTTGQYTSYETANGMADTVFKTSNYTGGWRAIGVENGKLVVISENCIPVGETGNENTFCLYNRPGFTNGVSELNNICAIFGNGTGAESARCVTLSDINAITGYNPNCVGVDSPTSSQISSGTKYGSGNLLNEYGATVTYIQQGPDVAYTTIDNPDLADAGDWHNMNSGILLYYDEANSDWLKLDTGDAPSRIGLVSNNYFYFPTTLTDSTSDANNGINTSSSILTALFNDGYWLADRVNYHTTEITPWSSCHYRCYCIAGVSYDLNNDAYGVGATSQLFSSRNEYDDMEGEYYLGIRPVVVLSSDYEVHKLN